MTTNDVAVTSEPEVVTKDRVVIRFAGDSGDGMQLTGDRFTSETAAFGNDLSTLPNYPAEIRAPAGTLPGVSSFQLHFANYDILTPGDRPDVLVAMNPAALKANIGDLPHGGVLIVNTDEFTKRNLTKVGYDANPLEDDSLADFQVHPVAMATLTRGALEETGLSKKDAERAKNMFALGLLSWMYHRPHEGTERFLREKFARKPEIAEANVLAFRAGHAYGETTEAFAVTYEVAPETPPIRLDDPVVSAPPVTDTPATTSTATDTSIPASTPSSEVPTTDPGDEVEPAAVTTGIADSFAEGWFSDPSANSQVALWGAVLILISVGSYLLSRKVRRDWVGLLVGIVPFTIALYFFFQNVNRLLPTGL